MKVLSSHRDSSPVRPVKKKNFVIFFTSTGLRGDDISYSQDEFVWVNKLLFASLLLAAVL